MSRLRKALRATEPWYDWGMVNVSNMDAATERDEVHGDVRYFDLQWLGVHFGLQFGFTPRASGPIGLHTSDQVQS